MFYIETSVLLDKEFPMKASLPSSLFFVCSLFLSELFAHSPRHRMRQKSAFKIIKQKSVSEETFSSEPVKAKAFNYAENGEVSCVEKFVASGFPLIPETKEEKHFSIGLPFLGIMIVLSF